MAKPEDENKPKGEKKPQGEKQPKGEKKPQGEPKGEKAEKGEKPAPAEGGEKPQKQPKGDKGDKGKGKKPEGEAGEGKKKEPKETIPAPPPRLYDYYKQVVRPAMKKAFNYPNDNAVPKIVKVVLNMGVGKARENPKMLEALASDLATIAGQKPVITHAKQSIANFKLRQGMGIGCKVRSEERRV